MSWLYRSRRIGKNGKEFDLLKFRTLKENPGIATFAQEEEYTRFGRFLRKTKLDELPQFVNVLRGEVGIVGPRPEEPRTARVIPLDVRKKLFSVKPGLTSLASIGFFDEGQILEKSLDPHKTYWRQIKPLKIAMDCFYVDNHDVLLDVWIIWKTAVKIIKSLFHA